MTKKTSKRLTKSSLQGCFRRCWEELRKVPGARRWVVGSDGKSIGSFRDQEAVPGIFADEAKILSDIAAGKYKPRALRAYSISKENGTQRHICIPTVSDRLAQRAVIRSLEEVRFSGMRGLPFTHSLEGTPDRTVDGLLKMVTLAREKHPYVYKTDIKSFFDKIKRDRLATFIRQERYPRVIAEFLLAAMQAEAEGELEGIRRGEGVRQGLPVSPLLANIYLKKFDDSLRKRGIVFARYVDDLIIFSDSESYARKAQDDVRGILSHLGLGLECDYVADTATENGKSKLCGPADPVTFLGAQISPNPDGGTGYRLEVDPKAIVKTKKNLAEYVRVSRVIGKKWTLTNILTKLESSIQGAVYARGDLYGVEEFEAELIKAKEEIIRGIFKDWFRIDIEGLSREMRCVLGIEPYGGKGSPKARKAAKGRDEASPFPNGINRD